MVSPLLLWVLLAYCIVGTIVTIVIFGPPMVELQYHSLAKEADLRFSVVRIRENAEPIAFYKGEVQEEKHITSRFYTLVEILKEKLNWELGLHMWTSMYYHAVILVPPIVIAPKYFKGETEFGTISQAGYAFGLVYFSLSILAIKFQQMTNLGAEVRRLNALAEEIDFLQRGEAGDEDQPPAGDQPPAEEAGLLHKDSKDSNPVSTDKLDKLEQAEPEQANSSRVELNLDGDGLVLEQLRVQTPDRGDVLIYALSLQVLAGQSLLIMGCSGCGKTSLLRTIAGLWNQGCGKVLRPPDE